MNFYRALPIVAFALAGSIVPAAAESWVCAHAEREHVILVLNGELLVAGPSGTLRYNVLQNDVIAFIAEHHVGAVDPSTSEVVARVSTVIIDKRSNRFASTTTQIGGPARQHEGLCRGYDEGRENSSPIVTLYPDWDAAVAGPAARSSR